jgi:hypothetical protein
MAHKNSEVWLPVACLAHKSSDVLGAAEKHHK